MERSPVPQKKINWAFAKLCENSYAASTPDLHSTDSFLNTPEIKSSKHDRWECLNQPISGTEIKAAITKVKHGKSPGTDGFAGEFYKLFSEGSIPHLKILLNDIWRDLGIRMGRPGTQRWGHFKYLDLFLFF